MCLLAHSSLICFKFQSDSINTKDADTSNSAVFNFKFQSDSINTTWTLSIYFCFLCFKFQSDSINTLTPLCKVLPQNALNSNLILLILTTGAQRTGCSMCFKFQSDSINTNWKCLVNYIIYSSLNSNLILLIPIPLSFASIGL